MQEKTDQDKVLYIYAKENGHAHDETLIFAKPEKQIGRLAGYKYQ